MRAKQTGWQSPMQQSTLTITNKRGLHARAAAKLVETASNFDASVRIHFSGKEADGKSIMSLLMLAAGFGSEIVVITEGHDELDAVSALQILINNRFNEEA